MPPIPRTKRRYVGIDPGKKGGLVTLDEEGNMLSCERMPPTLADTWDWVRSQGMVNFAVLERVSGYAGKKQPGSTMFNFGASYGALRMALTAAEVRFEETVPRTWQKAMSISPRKVSEKKTAWKNRLKEKAQQLFPGLKVDLAVADALLIAEFCRRKHEGLLR